MKGYGPSTSLSLNYLFCPLFPVSCSCVIRAQPLNVTSVSVLMTTLEQQQKNKKKVQGCPAKHPLLEDLNSLFKHVLLYFR